VTPVPNFAAWQIDTLAKYALEQYLQNLELTAALEQTKQDFKTAMQELRKHQDDWK
jgi:hypothetical protein